MYPSISVAVVFIDAKHSCSPTSLGMNGRQLAAKCLAIAIRKTLLYLVGTYIGCSGPDLQ